MFYINVPLAYISIQISLYKKNQKSLKIEENRKIKKIKIKKLVLKEEEVVKAR